MRSIKQVVIIQVGVTRRRLMVRMAKQPTYHRQRFLVHGGMASESVAQVVDADMAKPCAFAEALKAAVGVAAENWCFVRIADALPPAQWVRFA